MRRFTEFLRKLKPRRKKGLQKLAEEEKKVRSREELEQGGPMSREEALSLPGVENPYPQPGPLHDPRPVTERIPDLLKTDLKTRLEKGRVPFPQPGEPCPLASKQVLTKEGRKRRMKSSYSASEWRINCPLCLRPDTYITKQGTMSLHKAPLL